MGWGASPLDLGGNLGMVPPHSQASTCSWKKVMGLGNPGGGSGGLGMLSLLGLGRGVLGELLGWGFWGAPGRLLHVG